MCEHPCYERTRTFHPQSGMMIFLLFLIPNSGIFPLKFLYPAGSIHNLLFARHKGVALGTYFNLYILPGRSGVYNIAAYAGYRRLFIFRMNTFFHSLYCPP